MKLKSKILKAILFPFYLMALLMPVNYRKITFISLEHDHLSRDFLTLKEALEAKGEYEIQTVLFKYESDLKTQVLFVYTCIKQLFAINTSGLVLLDFNNFVVSNFKRPETKVLQVWHATGALKKFGNSAPRDFKIQGYDYGITNSDIFVEHYAEAFGINAENIRVTGIPETDKLFDQQLLQTNQAAMLEKYPEFAGKKVVLYAPTFRGRMALGFREVDLDLDALQRRLGDEYVIVYKPHPRIAHPRQYADNPAIYVLPTESIKKLFTVTDVLVSDYSAVIIDFLIMGRKIALYVPDLKEYQQKVGMYFDYEKEVRSRIAYTPDELVNVILSAPDMAMQKKLYQKMFKYQDGKSTERVIAWIGEIMVRQPKPLK